MEVIEIDSKGKRVFNLMYERLDIEEQQAYSFLDSKDLTFSFDSNYKLSDIMKDIEVKYNSEYLDSFPDNHHIFNVISTIELIEYLTKRYDVRFVPITHYELRRRL